MSAGENVESSGVEEEVQAGTGLPLGLLDVLLLGGFVVVAALVVYSRLKKKKNTPTLARSLSIE